VFDPSTFEGEIFVMCAEFIAVQVMPTLIQTLIREAPLMTLKLVGENIDTKCVGFEKGDLDFSIEIARSYHEDYHAISLGSFTSAVGMRKDHPLSGVENLNLNAILEYPFVQYALLRSQSGDTIEETRFDTLLKDKGKERKKPLVTAQLMTALNVLCSTDSLMMGTTSDLKIDGIIRKAYPEELELDTTVPIVLVQHSRTTRSQSGDTIEETRFDTLLKDKGKERKKPLVTAQLMTALNVLCSTDSLMMGTTSDLKIDGIIRKAYPKELELDMTVPIV
jgi:DNA-binding transcriptional LysR family regulator